ncbi:uncharacterized protein [Parasteatoda tepidariorum]|uniref:uncharacterized protein n=1 Tax=Parasteatoda tepidariorum TaxID=114398 RepID=UPI0039BD16B9
MKRNAEIEVGHLTGHAAPGFLAEETSSSSSETDGYEMLEVVSEVVSEETNLSSGEEEDEASDSDDMEELSAEIEHSESSTTDEEDVENLDSDDMVEMSAEMELNESSSSDENIAILNSEKIEELPADIEPKESQMILDKEIVATDGSDRSGKWHFEIDSRERKILAKANKMKESLDIVVGLKRCGDVSHFTKILEEKLDKNPDFAKKREMAREKDRKSFRYMVRRLFTGCFMRKY